MKLYTEELYNLYMKWVDSVPDEKSTFTPKEIVNAISNIIETNPSLIELPSDEELKEEVDKHIDYGGGCEGWIKDGWRKGAKWMKEQILNQNK